MTAGEGRSGPPADLPAPPALIDLVEQHEAACSRLLLGDLPGALLVEEDEFLLVGPSALAAVHLLRATAESFDRAAESWEEAFRQAGAPPAVWLSPRSTPPDAAGRLSRRGYRLARESLVRTYASMPSLPDPAGRAPVLVRPLRPEDADLLGDGMIGGWGLRGRLADAYRELLQRAVHRPEFLGFAAEVNGESAGFTYGVLLDGIYADHMVLTLPKFRRHGVATALRRHYFADAFRRGARYVWYRTDLPWFREPALTFHFRLFVRLPLLTRLLRPARRRWFQARRLRVAPNDSRWR